MSIATFVLVAALASGCSSAARARGVALQPDVDRGVELYNKREFQEAARVLEAAAKASPGNARGLTYLGLSRLELQQYGSAEEAFRQALEVDTSYAQAHYGLGLALGYLGRRNDAIASLQKAVELDPKNAYAHYHLGLALHQSGATDRALLHLHRFLELSPDAPEAPRVRELLSQLR
jgi:tetratricopeptide (TPR) repeat protein